MINGSQGATALVGMPGFVVGVQVEVGREWWLYVETTADVAGCEVCGTRAVGHGRRRAKVRDLPIAGRPVVLVWAKRIWRCPDEDCPVGTWTEDVDEIAPRSSLTERARAEICRRVGAKGHSVAELARDFGVGWHTAMAAVRDHGRPRVDHLSRLGAPSAVGLDETTFLAARPSHPTLFVTGIVDLDRHRLIDVVENRTAQGVSAWLDAKPDRWLAGIDVVTVDPYQGYANAVRASLDHADVVVDHFHAIRLANAAVDDVRRRVQQATLARRGHRDDPLYRIRRRLLLAQEKLTDTGRQRLLAALAVGDPDGEVAAAYLAKELLREVYDTTHVSVGRRRLEVFHRHCRDADMLELSRLSKTVSRWEHEILGWHRTGLSNGPTEAMNLLIKKIKRVGHGFRNFNNYRLRVLLYTGGCTWNLLGH